MFYQRLLVLTALLSAISPVAFANLKSSETIGARKGVFRLLSADVNETSDYHIRTSLQYFQEKNLLEDVRRSTITRTKSNLAFGYALTPHIHLSADAGFIFASSKPTPGGAGTAGTQSIDLVRAALAATGTYDVGLLMGMTPGRLYGGASLWIDFSKVTRFFKGPNIVPTLMLTGDFSDQQVVPFRVHMNTGFKLSTDKRYFDAANPATDFDRFATETSRGYAMTGALGVEFPVSVVTPSLEAHIEKIQGVGLAETPKWATIGLKGRPFPTKNIEVFGAVDIGLSGFKASTMGSPKSPAVPLWNAVIGFGIGQFGRKAGEIGVDKAEYDSLRASLAEKERTVSGLQRDLQYNTVEGRVIDAESKKPLSGVIISFPENPDLKPSSTDSNGRFVRYFKNLTGARVMFSADSFESSSKFMALKPGERVVVDVELQKDTGVQAADFVAMVTNESGAGVQARIELQDQNTKERFATTTDANGQVSVKVNRGTYDVIVKAEGYQSATDTITFEKGKTVLRTYNLAPALAAPSPGTETAPAPAPAPEDSAN